MFYISFLFLVSSSCKSVINGTYITPSVALVDTKVEINDSIDNKNPEIDSTLPPILKADTGSILTAKNISDLFQPTEKLDFQRNRTCIYTIHYLGGGQLGPEIIESQGKYSYTEEHIEINLTKSRAHKKGTWSAWKVIDETMKFNYDSNLDTLRKQGEKNIYLKQ